MQVILGQIMVMYPGVLWLAMLVAWPLVLHLLTRRVTRVVAFAAVQFLLDAESRKHSRVRLRRWWLLVLRCLAVAAVVSAMAGMMWRSEMPAGDGQMAAAVVLVDTSGSMRRMVDGRMLIDDARQAVGKLVDELKGEGVKTFVVAAGKDCQVVDEAGAIVAGYEVANWVGAMNKADELLSQVSGRGSVFVVTDGQRTGWQVVAGQKWEHVEAVEVVTVGRRETAVENLAVSDIKIEQRGDDAGIAVMARISNNGDTDIVTSVAVEIDGVVVNRQMARFLAGQTRQIAFEIGWDDQPEASAALAVVLGEDELDIDNRVFAVARGGGRIMVGVAAEQEEMVAGCAGYYLAKAFAADATRYDVKVLSKADELSANELGSLDLLVVTGEGGHVDGDVIRAFAEAGGAVMWFAGGERSKADRLVVAEGLAELDAGLAGIIETEPVKRGGGSRWLQTLALMEEDGRVLLRYQDGNAAAWRWRIGTGCIVGVDFAVVDGEGGLVRSSVFVPLIYELAELAMDGSVHGEELFVGQRLHVAVGRPVGDVVAKPVGVETVEGWVLREGGASVFIADKVSRPGVYRLVSGGRDYGLAAVNVEGSESDLRYFEDTQLQAILDDVAAWDSDGQAVIESDEARFVDYKLRRWLLVLAMVALGLEVILVAAADSGRQRRVATDVMLVAAVAALGLLMVEDGRRDDGATEGVGSSGGDESPVVLLDTSQSMAERDCQGLSRIGYAAEHWLSDWHGRVYAFDEGLHDEAAGLAADGRRTRLGASLLRLLNEKVAEGQGVFIISDGAVDDQDMVMQAAEVARQRGHALHTVCVGSEGERVDWSVRAVAARRVQVGDVVEVVASVGSHTTGEAELMVETDDAAAQQVAVRLDAAGRQQVTVPVVFGQSGYREILVAVKGDETERVLENNTQRLFIEVTKKPLRVLMIEGRPSRISRDLIRALRTDEKFAVDSVVQLAAQRQVISQAKGHDGAQAISLENYDVVWLGRGVDIQGLQGLTAGLGDYVLQGGHLVLTQGRPYNGGGSEIYWPVVFGDGEVRMKTGARMINQGESTAGSVMMPYGKGSAWLVDAAKIDAKRWKQVVHHVVKRDGYEPVRSVDMRLNGEAVKVNDKVTVELSGVGDAVDNGAAEVVVIDPADGESKVVLEREDGWTGDYRGQVEMKTPGVHRFVYQEVEQRKIERKIDVLADLHERLNAAANVKLMREVAALTGGVSLAGNEYTRFTEIRKQVHPPVDDAWGNMKFRRLSATGALWIAAAVCLWCCLAWTFRRLGVS